MSTSRSHPRGSTDRALVASGGHVMSGLLASLLIAAVAGCSPQPSTSESAWSARSERYEVYFGIVPVAATEERLARHGDAHDGSSDPARTHHLVVAIFDAGTGERIVDAEVRGALVPPRGPTATRDLVPMSIQDTVSYGNTFALLAGGRNRFEVDIRRGGRIEHFTFTFDNLHGSPR